MNKKGLERNLAASLFVLVLVVFSFAERDSKKLERMYTATQLIQKGSKVVVQSAAGVPSVAAANN